MKKTVCLALTVIFLALALCGCGFNFEKEDLSKYIKVGDYNSFTYEDFEALYLEYRKTLVENYKTEAFTIEEGFAVDFNVTAEIVTEEASEDGTTKTYSYTRYEPWCLETEDKFVDDYDFGRLASHLAFDSGLRYASADISDADDTERNVKLGEAFAFTYTIPSGYEDAAVAGKKVRFTVKVTDVLPGITDDAINSNLSSFFEKCGYYKDTVEQGDWLIIDFTARIDGEKFEGGEADDFDFLVGSGQVFPEFENALIGHKTGEAFVINVTFPENYEDTKIAGKASEIYIKIKSITNTNYTVRENTDFNDIWELKYAFRVRYHAMSTLMSNVVNASEVIEYPQSLLTQYEKYYKDEVASNVNNAMKSENYTEEQAKKVIYGSVEGADEYIKTSSENAVKEALTTYSVKKTLGLEYTKNDYNADIENMRAFMSYYYGSPVTAAELEAVYTRDILKMQFIYQRCSEALFAKLDVKGLTDIPQSAG